MLPTDYDSCAKVASQVKREVVLFCSKVAKQSMEQWDDDVHPRVAHCFLSRVGRQTGVTGVNIVVAATTCSRRGWTQNQ